MKSSIIFVLALISSTLAFANIEPAVAVIQGSSNDVFKVVYRSNESGKVSVKIFDANKQIVFTESISTNKSFSRPYNFSSLPKGEYTIEINDGTNTKIEKVNYQEENVNSVAATMSVKKMNSSNSKYLITAQSNGLNIMMVNVYDQEGNLLHNESHVVDKNFGVIYNITQISNVTFVLTDASGTSQSFTF